MKDNASYLTPDLETHFQGRRREAGRAESWTLDDPGLCFLVCSGTLEVFARITVDGAFERVHLATLEPGDIAFGLDGSHEAVVLEAVPAAAEVIETETARLAEPGALRNVAARATNRWVRLLGNVVLQEGRSAGERALHPGDSADLEAGDVIAANYPAWAVPAADGALWAMGARPVPGGTPVALGTELWAEAQAETGVACLGTDSPDLDLVAALRFHHEVVAGLLAERSAQTRRDDIRRIRDRAVADDDSLARATDLLAAMARQEETAQASPDEAPLVTAARVAGAAAGIHIVPPKGGAAALERIDDPVEAIANASGCEFRTVILEGRWWEGDTEPLLVFLDDDLTPMALVPRTKGKGAELVDPRSGQCRVVTATIAATLFPTAVLFYPAMPEGPVTLKRLLGLSAKGIFPDLRLASLMMLLVGTASMVTPMVVEEITGTVVQEARRDQLAILITALVVASCASVVFTFVQSVAVLRMEGRVDTRAQAAVWIRLLRLPASFFRHYSVGDLAQRALGVDSMRRMLTTSALSSLLSVATGIFSLGLMVYYDPLLAVFGVCTLVLYGLLMALFVRRAIHRQGRVLAQQGQLQSLVLQLLQAVSKLRVTGAESRAFGRWAAAYAELRKLTLAWQRNGMAVPIANALLTFVTPTVFIAAIAFQADQFWGPDESAFSWRAIDDATLGNVIAAPVFLAFFTAYGQLFAAVTSIVQTTMTLVGLVPLRDRLVPILTAQEESREDGEDPGQLRGDIEIANVEFRYVPDMPLVLKGLSLKIKAGSFVAFVGPSGAGKSSLIRLLLGFEAPEAGSIFYDGKDLARLDTRAVRRQLGVVLQNGRLMSGSIYDNILAGSHLTEEDAWEAARMAGLDADIEAMPMKMQTVVSEGAATLSGGQRQRLMIARAIVRRPRVLIFDEATSALDNQTQKTVSESLARINCTRIAIAHRLSTIADADQIFVIDAGHLVESGSYDELMELDGVFAKLARRQIT